MYFLSRTKAAVFCAGMLFAAGCAHAQPASLSGAGAPGAAPPADAPGAGPGRVPTAPMPNPIPAGWGPHGKPLYIFMVYSNSAPGEDEEFNTWYDRIHAPMMIEKDEFVWAQRFMLAPDQFNGGGTPQLTTRRYLVMFAMETDDIKKTAAAADKRMRNTRNVSSKALDYSTLQNVTWMALGPRITQKDAQKLLKEEEAAGRVPKTGVPMNTIPAMKPGGPAAPAGDAPAAPPPPGQ